VGDSCEEGGKICKKGGLTPKRTEGKDVPVKRTGGEEKRGEGETLDKGD